MGFFNRQRDSKSDAALSYFHLDALESSVIHPKFMDLGLVTSLCLTDRDADYAFSAVEFVEFCSGSDGAPTTSRGSAVILTTLQNLRRDVPSSQFDYRFCLYELNELESILARTDETSQ